ncbi:MAG: hypothetical protein B1H05_04830 [Candidatus Cloacimonas sp. 4484_140]|nr:MAG: hypothetical protein B1H05_04830 [Candidatus Cloacimonas sp. 4484_140]
MKNRKIFVAVFCIVIIACLSFCTKKAQEEQTLSMQNDELVKLEKFMDIPIYPNSEFVNITTPLRDDQIPNEPMQAQVTLIIDDYEKVPAFYEEKLGKNFTVDVENGKKYYELRFEKGEWLYIIYVGHDTFENKPVFSIERWER